MEQLPQRQDEAEAEAEAIKQRLDEFERILSGLPEFGVSTTFIHFLRTYGTMNILGAETPAQDNDGEPEFEFETKAHSQAIAQCCDEDDQRLCAEDERRLRDEQAELQRLLKDRFGAFKQRLDKQAACYRNKPKPDLKPALKMVPI